MTADEHTLRTSSALRFPTSAAVRSTKEPATREVGLKLSPIVTHLKVGGRIDWWNMLWVMHFNGPVLCNGLK